MECIICNHGTTFKGKVTVKLERNMTIVLLKEVPAQICENCGHYYLDEKTATSTSVLNEAGNAIQNGAELEIICYREVA
jgi:YgiT-type zinc finger domain-containing protein